MKMMNPMQMPKGIGNPRQIIQGIMGNSQMMQNPMIRNVMGMAQKVTYQVLKILAEILLRNVA